MIAGIESDDEMHPGQGGVREGRIIGGNPAAICLRQQGAGLGAQARVIALTRDVKQNGGEPIIGINAFEQSDSWAVIEVKDRLGGGQQVADGRLEDLVPWIILDDVLEALLIVAARQGAGFRQNGL